MKAVLRLLPVIATRRRLFLETILWSILSQTAVLGLALGLAAVVGRVASGTPVSLSAWTPALVSLCIIAALTLWRESWVSHDLAYSLIGILRNRSFEALRVALPARTSHRRTGDLVSTVSSDIETLEWLYAHTVAQSLSSAIVLAISAAVSISITPLLLLVWVPLLAVTVAVPVITARCANRNAETLASTAATLRSELLDTIRGIRELRGADALPAQVRRLSDSTLIIGDLHVSEAKRLGSERAISDAMFALAALGAIIIPVSGRVAIDPADIPLAFAVSVAGLGPGAQIADLLRNAGVLRESARRINAVIDTPPSIDKAAGMAQTRVKEGERGLVFDDVTFSYGGDPPVLHRFHLQIRPGEVVALSGPSGSGKTTAARLALRFWDPGNGSIRINGTDLRSIADDELRALISVVPQSSPLLRGTIESNILLGDPSADLPRLNKAAKAAGLNEPAAGLPLGLKTPVGEHGTGLSGGQRARVAIARALLCKPAVLILDEATASLDIEADNAILELLKRTSDTAVLLIAHRPTSIAAAHRNVMVPVQASTG